MRLEGRMRLGYYPLDEREARRIRRFLRFGNGPASALDPCAGTGAALLTLTADSSARRYGIELDSYRAAEARNTLHEVIHGNAFDVKAPVESFSLLYLNPPYDFEVGQGKNQRMEKLFLEEFFRWLKPGGVLIMVVPFERIHECRTVLSPHFKDKAIYRLTEPDAVRYKQAVLFGVRRSAAERNRLGDHAVNQANWKLHELTHRYEANPPLPDEPDRAYAIPPSGPVRMEHRGLPLDIVEDRLAKSPAWLQVQRVTHARRRQFFGRPLTPLHAGHVGLCAVSGLLNGVFGTGADRHVAYWEATKVVDRTEEEGDAGETVVREKERFSQRLTLLYADGRIQLLSEKPREEAVKEAPHGECPPSHGEAEVRAPVEGHDH
jgi:predicted RNA methylase